VKYIPISQISKDIREISETISDNLEQTEQSFLNKKMNVFIHTIFVPEIFKRVLEFIVNIS